MKPDLIVGVILVLTFSGGLFIGLGAWEMLGYKWGLIIEGLLIWVFVFVYARVIGRRII